MADGEPVERAHLEAGDVILSVNGKPVTDMAHFQSLYDQAAKLDRVALEVERDREVFTSVLKVKEYAPASDPSE